MNKPATTLMWLEFTIDSGGSEIRVSARGIRGEHISARPSGIDRDTLLRFAAAVEQAASFGQPLDAAVLEEARKIQREVFGGEVNALFARLKEAAGGPLLVRLLVPEPELRAVPWEALCNAGEALGFWGTSPNVLPVRCVASGEPWQPQEVRGAVKVLAIAPTGSAGLANLKQALAQRIAMGEVEWLDPVEGPAAKVPGILERLRREPIPHVIHFLGHGGVDDQGRPALRMADDDDDETWLPAEVLAQQLASSFRGKLRLIVLEACEGAKPSGFASAAEILARAGADAVVAHLWPVKSAVGRICSTQLYRAMTSTGRDAGDIALAMNEARRAILAVHDSSAEAMSPVLYLRGPDGRIFDFEQRSASSLRGRVAALQDTSGPTPVDRHQGAATSWSFWKGGRAALSSVFGIGALLVLLTLIYLGQNTFFQPNPMSLPISPDHRGCSTGRSFYAGTCVDNRQVDFAVCVREVRALTASSMVDEAIKRHHVSAQERSNGAIVDDIQQGLAKLPLSELQAIIKFCKDFADKAGIAVPQLPPPPLPPPSPPTSTLVVGVPKGCPAGLDDCDKDPAHVCETDVRTSGDHCGNCGTRCVPGANAKAICEDGKCVGVSSCIAGYADCDGNASTGCEADLNAPTTCGACNNNCPIVPNSAPVCHSGQCTFKCYSDYADCNKKDGDGCETSLNSRKTCGACDNDCTRVALQPNMTATCESGKCAFECQSSYADCNHNVADGCETKLDSPANCGSCGVKCAKYCVVGICFDKWPFTGDPPDL